MNQTKIGNFIADMRRKQGLTQKQLADQINVTDKTVSKWETGYRMPDASILLELSSVLKIDVNELLAGEKFISEDFSSEEYVKKTESNIVNLVKELNDVDKKKKSRSIGTIFGIILIGIAFLALLSSNLSVGRIADIFDWPTLLYLLGLKFIILSVSGWFHDYFNAFRACFPDEKLSEIETKLSIQAMKYACVLTLTLGCLIFALSLFSLLNYMNSLSSIWPALAQIVLVLIYAAIVETVYVILIFGLKRNIHSEQMEE